MNVILISAVVAAAAFYMFDVTPTPPVKKVEFELKYLSKGLNDKWSQANQHTKLFCVIGGPDADKRAKEWSAHFIDQQMAKHPLQNWKIVKWTNLGPCHLG